MFVNSDMNMDSHGCPYILNSSNAKLYILADGGLHIDQQFTESACLGDLAACRFNELLTACGLTGGETLQ